MLAEDIASENMKVFRHLSSFAGDVWHPSVGSAGAYEWWYFDAISNDGRDALVIIFLADFIFSPRFNRAVADYLRGGCDAPRPAQFPALSVCVYRDGRLSFRANNEYTSNDFTASVDEPACRIARSSFHAASSSQGHSYDVKLDEPLRGGRRLTAELRWTVTDGDLLPAQEPTDISEPMTEHDAPWHEWNLVAPRCRVSGMVMVKGEGGETLNERRFDGVGYHDHNQDRRWMPATVAEWQWGRAHFDNETTAVFYRYREQGNEAATTRLFLIRDEMLGEHDAHIAAGEMRAHHFGLRYPRTMRFTVEGADAPLSLSVTQRRVIEGSYFYLRFLGEATLDTGDGQTQSALAITEHLSPRTLRWRWLDWLTSMRIGRRGRTSFLP